MICRAWNTLSLMVAIALLLSACGTTGGDVRVSEAYGRTFYVSPDGNDANEGTSSDKPLKTIQLAVDRAQAGETIQLAPGIYLQDITTKFDGTAEAPITITGPADAVVKGSGRPNIILIDHDYIILDGFTIDGLEGPADSRDSFRNKLVFAQSVTGLKVLRMTLRNAAGACLRLQNNVMNSELAYNTISHCGAKDFKFDGGGNNGEGIYVGTSVGHSEGQAPDNSNNIWIHHNTIDTQGSECVDIKPRSSHNIIEHNTCTGTKTGGIVLSGDENILRNNEIFGVSGFAVVLRGKHNQVYENNIHDNRDGIRFAASPQGKICCNTMTNTGRISAGDDVHYDPTAPSDQ